MTTRAAGDRAIGPVIARAVLFGPAIGTTVIVVVWVTVLIAETFRRGGGAAEAAMVLPELLIFVGIAFGYGYLIGAVPAVLGGFIFAVSRYRAGFDRGAAAFAGGILAVPGGALSAMLTNSPLFGVVTAAHLFISAVLTARVVAWRERNAERVPR